MKTQANTAKVIMTFFLVVCLVIASAGAYSLCGYRLINGISGIKWTMYNYNSSSFPSNYSYNYATYAANSILSWDSSLSNCTFVRYTDGTTSGCNVYFVFGDYGDDGFYGGCWFYDAAGNKVSPSGYYMPTSNYDYVIVRCNNHYLKTFSQANRLRCFFAHELGHVFGLNHVSSLTSLMYPNVVLNFNSSSPYVPQSDDINGVNAIY